MLYVIRYYYVYNRISFFFIAKPVGCITEQLRHLELTCSRTIFVLPSSYLKCHHSTIFLNLKPLKWTENSC